MLDLFYPKRPTYFRKGKVVSLLTPEPEQTLQERRKGIDKERARQRQARYRAKMMADPVRYQKHLDACKRRFQKHRAQEIERMRVRAVAIKAALNKLKTMEPKRPAKKWEPSDYKPDCPSCGCPRFHPHFSWCRGEEPVALKEAA